MTDDDSLRTGGAVLIDADTVSPEDFRIGPGEPAKVRPLRKLEDGALRSGLLRLPRGWSSRTRLRVSATVQFLVRRGQVAAGSRILPADAFVVVPAGGTMPVITAMPEAELLVIFDQGLSFEEVSGGGDDGGDAVITGNVYEIEPIVPVIAGRPLIGFERRVLWIDPVSGADTRLLRIPAGFSGQGPNWHPVNEEIFCLDGEIAPAVDRTMKAGWFLWNPARTVHGHHEVTLSGCTLLEWHDGPWELVRWAAPTQQTTAQAPGGNG